MSETTILNIEEKLKSIGCVGFKGIVFLFGENNTFEIKNSGRLQDKAERYDSMVDERGSVTSDTLENLGSYDPRDVVPWRDKAERFDAMVKEYVKAKGEASELRGRLDSTIMFVKELIKSNDQIISNIEHGIIPRSDIQLELLRVATHMLRSILETAKGEGL